MLSVSPSSEVITVKKQAKSIIPSNKQEALANGFTVDSSCYPWIAYTGPRFAPTKHYPIRTDLEEQLFNVLTDAEQHLEYCGWGDSWERECAYDSKLPDRVTAALKAADLTGASQDVKA